MPLGISPSVRPNQITSKSTGDLLLPQCPFAYFTRTTRQLAESCSLFCSTMNKILRTDTAGRYKEPRFRLSIKARLPTSTTILVLSGKQNNAEG